MKKFYIFFVLLFLPINLTAKPYYSEYIEYRFFKEYIIIFHGNIPVEEEARIRVLEQRYLENNNKSMRRSLARELSDLGVSVTEIENQDKRRAGKIPHPPEFHHY